MSILYTYKASIPCTNHYFERDFSFDQRFARGGLKLCLDCQISEQPLASYFSKYRQMNGGRFLVSLREVDNSEKISKNKKIEGKKYKHNRRFDKKAHGSS